MDLISELPDSIRNCILSFLPMEEAIRTSALSTQWRNVCYSLTKFDFWENCLEEKIKKGYNFEDIVDQTISRHDGSSIETFNLSFKPESFHDDARINSWITFAIKHKVKDLRIWIKKFNSLPACLFTSDTLTHLCLRGVTLNTPAELRFPMLKMFELLVVKFNGSNQTNQLVVNCLSLEFLSILSCSWKNTDHLIIHALNLKTLYLFPSCAHVSVHCPHLNLISYSGNPPDISSESLSSLLDVSFGYPSFSVPETTLVQNVDDQHVRKIVMGLSNAVSLSLDQFWLEILGRNGGITSNQALPFFCLKRLYVRMFAMESQVYFIPVLLKIYPNLKTLNIRFMDKDEHTNMLNMGGYFHQQQLSDADSLESLEKVTIEDFEGSDCEFYLVRQLLEKAKILKKMEIVCSDNFDENESKITGITEMITQITAVSPFVTTTIYSRKEATNKWREDMIARGQRRVC